MKISQFRAAALFIALVLLLPDLSNGQDIFHPYRDEGVYSFLDELASAGIIEINTAVRPLSRKKIAELLSETSSRKDQLTVRQQKELEFYMKDFYREAGTQPPGKKRPDLFHYSDSLFSITVNPILGGEYLLNPGGSATYWRNGADVRAYAGKWGFYASLRDNHEKPLLGLPEYLTRRTGGHIKNSTDWSEMKGGVTWSWKWGFAGLVKDRQVWGTGYNGANIFGGNNPSFVSIRIHMNPVKWFEFDYMHGWLNSMVVDSTRSYWVTNSYGTDYREVYHKKYLAANMFTFRPLKGLEISAGNSIVYSDLGLHPGYLMPLFFYKSVDHSINSGIDNMNSQMFLNISSFQIRRVHLYASCFVDELSVARISKKDQWNFLSWKAGARLFNLPAANLEGGFEFTYTYPLTFMHYVPTLTFESNGYNLGHWLKDNAREYYADVVYKPVKNIRIKAWYSDAARGKDFTEAGGPRVGNPPLETIEWSNKTLGLSVTWQPYNDLYLNASLVRSDINGRSDWTPDFLGGIKTTLSAGITYGF